MAVTGLSAEKVAELAERRAAAPDLDWDGVEPWVARSLALLKPGGVVSVVLPDGKPFIAKKAAG